MQPFCKRTWIDIDLDKLAANYHTACRLTDALVTCVIKSNAYGHGAVRVAQCLQQEGCRSFAVSCVREALELRKASIEGEILVMGLADEYLLADAVAAELTLTAGSVQDLLMLEQVCTELNKTVKVHIKVNTGFHRLGFDCTEAAAEDIAAAAAKLSHVRLEGVFSHLGLVTRERDEMQHDNLMRFHAWLKDRGVHADEVHICDSIGLVRYPQWHHSRVRVGAMLFGVKPSRSPIPFEDYETLIFRTTVSQVHEAAAGEIVGYADDMPLTRNSRIATLCAGYGDGYPRSLSNGNGKVMIRGQFAPVVGLVCMDQMMVDVTDIPGVEPGDVADLLGGGISYDEMSAWAHTNRNECISILSRRPVRVYWQGGKIVTTLDNLMDERRDF